MLRVGERILLLALSDDPDKHPLGYLSSRLLTDVEGASAEFPPFGGCMFGRLVDPAFLQCQGQISKHREFSCANDAAAMSCRGRAITRCASRHPSHPWFGKVVASSTDMHGSGSGGGFYDLRSTMPKS